jgi:hypothetical protein
MKYFSNTRAINTNNTNNTNNTINMSMTIRPNNFVLNNNINVSSPPIIITSNKKVKWGEPTWFLFHTLSVKIKDIQFNQIRRDLLNQIYAICINLPCPDCANHAKSYLDGTNFNTIQTKDDFKKFLFDFHNSVNIRKGYPLFNYDDLEPKYSRAITIKIIQNFMFHFSDKNRSIKLLPTDLIRHRLCDKLKIWFNTNISAFE